MEIFSQVKTLFRLAAYIENVRRLELENGRLEQQVSSIEETNTREVTSVRNMYDKELSQVQYYQTGHSQYYQICLYLKYFTDENQLISVNQYS